MNEDLKKLYIEKLNDFSCTDTDKEKFSYPFLIKAPNNYIQAKNKIMIVGQETHDWCGKLNNFSILKIDNTLNVYENTLQNRILSRTIKSKGKSCFIHRLVKINKQLTSINNTEIIWNNILKFDCNGKSAKKYPDVVNISVAIFKKEIEILKPNILLFQTGVEYDFILKKIFLERKTKYIQPKKLWKFISNNSTIYRINHPCARIKGGIKQFYNASIEDIENLLLGKYQKLNDLNNDTLNL